MKFYNSQKVANASFTHFKKAVKRVGLVDRYFQVGNLFLHLKFAGQSLVSSLTSAISHLAVDQIPEGICSSNILSISLFDSQSTSEPFDDFPFKKNMSHKLSQRWYSEEGGVQIYFQQGVNSMQLLDRESNQALYWVSSVERIPFYVVAAPFIALFHWWFNDRGATLVHGGAISDDVNGVLITGKGGSGKSTTVLSCLKSELRFVSDDYCMFKMDPVPKLYSLYSSAKLTPSNRFRFPYLSSSIWRSASDLDEKLLFLLNKNYKNKIIPSVILKAILLPCITGKANTTYEPVSSLDAMRALAPTSIIQLPGKREQSFERMAELVRKIPSYRINVGCELTQIPQMIAQLLKNTGSDVKSGIKEVPISSS